LSLLSFVPNLSKIFVPFVPSVVPFVHKPLSLTKKSKKDKDKRDKSDSDIPPYCIGSSDHLLMKEGKFWFAMWLDLLQIIVFTWKAQLIEV
jgi:hypothetical protein